MTKKFIRVALITCFLSINGYAQMVKGYFPYYRSVAQANAVQYNYLTDVIYAFAQLNSDGSLSIMTPTVFDAVKARCVANNVKLWIAIGGWGLSGNFSGVASDATRRNTLANACLNLCSTHNLEGIDIDWEFPAASDKSNFTAMLGAIRSRLGTSYKLSAALGGESFTDGCVNKGHVPGVEAAAFAHLDFFNIMSYDAPSCVGNHTSVDFTKKAMDGYNALGCPYNKMIPGLAFYGRCAGEETYANFSNSNPSGFFNDADGIFNSWCYDSKPTIDAKVNYAMCTNGSPGVMIWELSQDRNDQFSLLKATREAVDACACPFNTPNLGDDKSLCGTSSITLNSGVATASSRTFTWQKDGVNIPGFVNSVVANSYSATASGTYKVIISQGTCTKEDVVVVTNTLPTPTLGSDRSICNPSFYDLSPSNLSSFPIGTTFQWRKDGNNITGATGNTLMNVRSQGLYRIVASIVGCVDVFDEVNITSTLPSPVDGCSPSSGTVSLSINNATGGPYNWYQTANSSTILGTGTTFNASSVSSTTTFYVSEGAGTSGSIGGSSAFGAAAWGNYASPTMELNLTTNVAGVKINSLDIYVHDWSKISDVLVRIATASGTIIGSTAPVSYDNSGSGTPYRLTINTSSIPALGAAGDYKIYLIDNTTADIGTSAVRFLQLTGDVTEATNTIRLKFGSYQTFNNIQFVAGSGCARLPVIARIDASCNPLSVTWTDFDAFLHKDYVICTWETLSEVNNQYFEVQQSLDGFNFKSIARVNAKGRPASYSFTDHHLPFASSVYYRVAQFDTDGKVSYTKTKQLVLSNVYFEASPNPFSTTIQLQMVGDNSVVVNYKIVDSFGKIVDAGETNITENGISLGDKLIPGFYLLTVEANNINQHFKIIKK